MARPSTPAAKTDPDATISTNTPQHHISHNRTSLDEPDSPSSTSSPSPPKDADGEPVSAAEKPALERTQSQASQFSKGRITIIMLSLAMALFLAALDVTIVTTALPVISEHFHASASDYTWVGSAYLLASASSSPVWGKISDIFGRKNIILLANLIFLIGSLIAGISTSIGMLIGARVIQGIGGGGLVVLVYVCIGDLFSMRERPKYYGFMGMVWAIASGVGPVIGGAFTESVTWRWCFYINLPLDGISLILLFVFLKLDNPRTPLFDGLRSIDWIGVLTIVGGVVMFLFGMESGGTTHPWDSAFTLCLIIFGIVTIVLFFINEWKFAKYPIIPLRLFHNLSNLASLGVVFIHGFVFIGGSYYLPLYFQVVLGAGPILSGVYLFAMVVTFSIVSAMTGIFIKKTGMFREPIWFGLFFMTLGYGLFIDLPDHAVWSKIIIYQVSKPRRSRSLSTHFPPATPLPANDLLLTQLFQHTDHHRHRRRPQLPIPAHRAAIAPQGPRHRRRHRDRLLHAQPQHLHLRRPRRRHLPEPALLARARRLPALAPPAGDCGEFGLE
jgi:EmrB/QacA subfamily drug resistance transporter